MPTFRRSNAVTRIVLVVALVFALCASAFASTPASAAGLVTRQAGAGRTATAVAISRATFRPGVPVVYVAEQADLAYSLPGAAAAGALGGPVLLTARNALPGQVARELTRLRPARIVVLGGTRHVSNAVLARLRSYARRSFARLARTGLPRPRP